MSRHATDQNADLQREAQAGSAKRRVFLVLPSFELHDAIGNDVFQQYQILSRGGYTARILTENSNPSYASIANEAEVEADAFWSDPDAILIYHHSTNWQRGERILARSKNKVVIKYHNVTPPEYFASYAQNYYHSCLGGVEATARLARLRVDFVWGASQYNAEEFIRLGVPRERCRVMPPMHRIEELGRAPLDSVLAGVYRGAVPNVLFVGAFRPNKGHFKALETFAAYRRIAAAPARLLLVGSMDPALKRYSELIVEHARRLEIDDSVFLAHSVTLSQLRTYYTVANVFLCVSEHEGFCVPLVEAMYFRVPIVAWATTAVGETCNGCGRVFSGFDPPTLAHAIDECIVDPSAMRCMASDGRRRYETVFHPSALEHRFLNLMQEVEAL